MSCGDKFCEEHVHTERHRYSYPPVTPTHECFTCFHKRIITPYVEQPRVGLTAKELYSEVRKVCPKGYISITITLNESDPTPNSKGPSLEWTIYHDIYRSYKGLSPEQALDAFKAAVSCKPNPTSPISNIDV